MKTERDARLIRGLMLAGVALAGLMTMQGILPCKLMQRCGPSERTESSATPTEDSLSPHDVLVTVNGKAITRAEVDAELVAALGPGLEKMPAWELNSLRAQWTPKALEILVMRTLLDQAAEAANLPVSQDELAAEIERVSSALPEGITLADLQHQLGLSDEGWVSEVTKKLRIDKLLEAHGVPGEQPSTAEVEAFYSDNRQFFEVPQTVEARHILIAITPQDEEANRNEKRQKADAIRERLTANNALSFEAVAAEVSDCPSASEGGYLGSFARGQMVAAFEDAAFHQEPGVVGPVIETPFGYHIIKVEARTEPRTRPLDEVRDAIATHLHGKKREAAIRAYLDQLRAEASISHT